MTTRSGRRRTLGNDENKEELAVVRSTCYCLAGRTIGKEFLCLGCGAWFHLRCLYDVSLSQIGRLPYRVCYAFVCRSCSSNNRESLDFTEARVTHICVTVLANLTAKKLHSEKKTSLSHEAGSIFVNIEEIVDFMEKNWKQLSSDEPIDREELKSRAKSALVENITLFKGSLDDSEIFALNITLSDVSPTHEALKKNHRRDLKTRSLPSRELNQTPPNQAESSSKIQEEEQRLAIDRSYTPFLIPKIEIDGWGESEVTIQGSSTSSAIGGFEEMDELAFEDRVGDLLGGLQIKTEIDEDNWDSQGEAIQQKHEEPDGVFKVPFSLKPHAKRGSEEQHTSKPIKIINKNATSNMSRNDPLDKCFKATSKQIQKKAPVFTRASTLPTTMAAYKETIFGTDRDSLILPLQGATTRAAWKQTVAVQNTLTRKTMKVMPKRPQKKKNEASMKPQSKAFTFDLKKVKEEPVEEVPIEDFKKKKEESKKDAAKNIKPSPPEVKVAKTTATRNLSTSKIKRSEKNVVPFNQISSVYFAIELDPHAVKTDYNNQEYRVVVPLEVTISPNDRAEELKVSQDGLTVSGYEGHRIARATHGIKMGTWYYEVEFVERTEGSCVRIGWSREECPVQCSLGYSKYSYAWRSDKGTKFHDGKGRTYQPGGYKEGDILGVLIHLPVDPVHPNLPSKDYLPPSRKNSHMHGERFKCFRRYCSYNSPRPDDFNVFPGSKIEFFLNGSSCGVAYEDIYRGLYFPSVSLYGYGRSPAVRFHFGDSIKFLPPGARRFAERAAELPVEQTLSDMIFLASNDKDYNDADY